MSQMSNKMKMGLGARALWLLCRSVAIMPHWYQYGFLSNLIYFVLRYLIRYRRQLIITQIADSFPEKSSAEVIGLVNEYYHTLAESFVGTMTLAGMSDKKRREVLEVHMAPEVREAVKGRHFVYLSSHHNFWEFAQFSGLYFDNHMIMCAYHPLKSRAWEELYYNLRYSKDALPIPSGQLIRFFLEHRQSGVDGRNMLLGLLADQNTPPKGEVHWYDFLNHKTLFLEGGEQLALKFGLPVLYLGMSRISAGKYRGEVMLLYDGSEKVEKHQITERYVRQLERDIMREPSRWMWSHRRWKYVPHPETGEPIYYKRLKKDEGCSSNT